MLKLTQSILVVLLMSALSSTARADGERAPGFLDPDGTTETERPAAPTAAALLAAYRRSELPYIGESDTGENWHQAAVQARSRAESDLNAARAQLIQARAEVARLIGEIRIEGAENFDIGGEVRAARMIEAEWQRAVDAILAHVGKIDAAIVMRGGEAPPEPHVRQSQR